MPNRKVTFPLPNPEDALRDELVRHLRQPGGDPSDLLELLALATESRPWERSSLPFAVFVTAPIDRGGIGWTIPNLRAFLRLTHRYEASNTDIYHRMQSMRRVIETLLISEIDQHGGNRREPVQGNNIILKTPQKGTSRQYTLARLQRDRPDLAQAVLSGEMSANAAAISAGFRKRSVSVYPDDAQRTIAMLLQHFDPETLKLIIEQISK